MKWKKKKNTFKNYTTRLHFFYGVDGPPYTWFVKLKEISILVHLQIISVESDNITDCKLICQLTMLTIKLFNAYFSTFPRASMLSKLTIKPFNAYFHISKFPHFQTTKISTLTIKPFNAYFHISTFPHFHISRLPSLVC